jgi:hypothetical protein
MSETALRSSIVDALNATGMCRVWSVHAGRVKVRGGWMHLSPVGTPDICGYALGSGRFIGIEIKVAGNRTDKARAAAQTAFQVHIATHGGISGQVESVAGAMALIRRALERAA